MKKRTAREELRNWAPKRGKKVMGIPEWLGFVIVLAVVLFVLLYFAR